MLTALVVTLLSSGPVARTLSGCVVDGRFFSISSKDGPAYSISMSRPLGDFEGKAIRVTGNLYPGDRFEPHEKSAIEVTAPTCDDASRKLIVREKVVRLRVDATYAWKEKRFDDAQELLERAFALDPAPDCDSFTDRATFFATKGDVAAATKDLEVLRAGRCGNAKKMNPLLLQDLGAALLERGEQSLARDALTVALKACDGDWCRGDIEKQLAALKNK